MTTLTTQSEAGPVGRARRRSARARTVREGVVTSGLVFCSSVSVLTTIAIIVVLATETVLFFTFEKEVLTGTARGDEVVPITMTIDVSESGGRAALTEDLRDTVSLQTLGILGHAEKLDVFGPDDRRVARLSIAGVENGMLVLESVPSRLDDVTARVEIRRDEVTLREFFLTGTWSPLLGTEKHFGIWPLVSGTVMVTVVAMVFAIPLGLVTAIFLSEYAPRPLRAALKPVLEVLAGIPTVVYGFFALTVITPALKSLMSGIDVYNVLSAGLAVGIMCLPIVTSISEDALQAVPRSLREGAYATGATRFDVSLKVVMPAALSGIVASALLSVARAVGETMIVTLAAGNLARLVLDPRGQGQTMTAYMVQIFLGDTSNFGVEYYSSYAVAAMLFVMTLLVTIVGHLIRLRFREAYE